MNDITRRNARSIREAGQRRFDIAYRLVNMPPPAFLGARQAREAAGARIEAREALRVGIWEAEGGALPPEADPAAVRYRTDAIRDRG